MFNLLIIFGPFAGRNGENQNENPTACSSIV